MDIGFFTMPIHPIDKDYKKSLSEDRQAFLLADRIGFSEAYCGEHVTDSAENITSSALFIASIASCTKNIRLGTGTVNMPNSHPAAIAGQIAMLDHMLDGRLNFGISPGGLASDAEVFGNLDKDRKFLTEGGVFTDDQIDAYIELKFQEIYKFEHTPHPIEFEMYYSG